MAQTGGLMCEMTVLMVRPEHRERAMRGRMTVSLVVLKVPLSYHQRPLDCPNETFQKTVKMRFSLASIALATFVFAANFTIHDLRLKSAQQRTRLLARYCQCPGR